MTQHEWNQIEFFSPDEKWGDPTKMSFQLLRLLDALRRYCGLEILIHNGYATEGHSEHSQHYVGRAADLHIQGLTLINQYILAEQFDFSGIGLYPFWNNPGLHLDVRPVKIHSPYSRWVRLQDRYATLNEHTLLRASVSTHLLDK